MAELTVHGLHQWDYGRKLKVMAEGLPAQVEIHFACAGMETAVVRFCGAMNGVFLAAIPDQCLEQTTPIVAWVCEVGETSGKTLLTIHLPIIARTKPQPAPTVPEDVSDKYTEAVAAMNGLVEDFKSAKETIRDSIKNGIVGEIESGEIIAKQAGNADHAEKDNSGRELQNFLCCTGDGFIKYKEGDEIEAGLLIIRVASATNAYGKTSILIADTGPAGYPSTYYSAVYYDGNHETHHWPARLVFTSCDDKKSFTITTQRYSEDGKWTTFLSGYEPNIFYQYLVKYPTK